MPLSLHRTLAHWLALFLRPADFKSLKAFLESPLDSSQADYWKDIYLFPQNNHVLFNGKNTDVAALKSILVDQKRAVVLVEQRLFLKWHQDKIESFRVGKNEVDQLIWTLALRGNKGMTLPDIHKSTWKKVVFRQDRHASACYILVSRCRARVRVWGIDIELNKATALYTLVYKGAPLGILRERVGGSTAAPTERRTAPNRLLILKFLEKNGPASGKCIAEALGVQRQSIHALLKTMVATNDLNFRSKGQHSQYMLPF